MRRRRKGSQEKPGHALRETGRRLMSPCAPVAARGRYAGRSATAQKADTGRVISVFRGTSRFWRRRTGLGVNAATLYLVINPAHADISGGVIGSILGSTLLHTKGVDGRTERTDRGDDNGSTDQDHGKSPIFIA